MIDQSPLPSRQLQLFARIARWTLGLVLAFWLLVIAVWMALHGFIVPRIGQWQDEVERMATQALGAPVRISAIQGQTNGLFPSIHLQGVSVLDTQGREALKLPSVVVTISARSILRWGLEQLYVEGAELDIRHLPDGTWQVAGLNLVQSDASESSTLAWLLEQPELLIRKGKLRFTDEQRGIPSIHLNDVSFVLRNRHWSHVLRLEAVPEAEDGKHLLMIGAFRESLLPTSEAPWKQWSGQWYTDVNLYRFPDLPWLNALDIASIDGRGHTRLWIDVKNGAPIGFTADLAVPYTQIQWQDKQTEALDMRQLQGRLQLLRKANDWQIQTKNFSFQLADARPWPSSNWSILTHTNAHHIQHIEVHGDYADISMASRVMAALPLADSFKQTLTRWMPQGIVRQLNMQWRSDGHYQAQGEIEGLVLQPQAAEQGIGIPGLNGMNARFALSQKGGQATLEMHNGVLHFPGVFEDSALPLQELQAQVQWELQDDHIKVEIPEAQFANADAKGHLSGWWQTGKGSEQYPGSMHLQGGLLQANGARVHRYLPLQIADTARHYVRDSVMQGDGRNVEFEVRGNLKDMPFDKPGTGRFYIKAPVYNVAYAFVPPSLQKGNDRHWPILKDLQGDLIFDGSSMFVQNAQSGFAGHPQLHMGAINARIADMKHPIVEVHANGHLDMAATLDLVRKTPLSEYTGHALDTARANGSSGVAFDLELPIHNLAQSKVKGHVEFVNTSLQFNTQTPWLTQLQGAVQFNEKSFALHQVRGHALGDSLQISGGMPSLQEGVNIQAQGIATAHGLRQETQLPLLQAIANQAQGSASYNVEILALDNAQTITIRSDLKELLVSLPAPLNKDKLVAWPLTLQQSITADQQQILRVHLPDRLQVTYAHSANPLSASPVKGLILVGKDSQQPTDAKQLPQGVQARIHLEHLDVDTWTSKLRNFNSSKDIHIEPKSQIYLPNHIQLDIQTLQLQERTLGNVSADFLQHEGIWHGQFKAKQFEGHAQYTPPGGENSPGLLFARLAYLNIPQAEAQRLHDAPLSESSERLDTLPALDIEVESFEVAGKKLGKLELQARNVAGQFGRDWMLEKLYLTAPEARWKAHGSWAIPARGVPRMTHLGFLLEMESSGKLLERLEMPGVIRDGKGRLSGNIAWHGTPITPDWQSMDGGVHMEVEQGQFLKAEPGLAKLLSVLSLQSLARRIHFDFRDVFSQGFAFDFIRGDIAVTKGVARTNNLQMRGLNAAVLMEGSVSLANETQDLKVVVVPEINAMTASLVATAINPVIGLGSFLAQMFLRGPLMEAATRTFHIHGTWTDPVVEPMKPQAVSHP